MPLPVQYYREKTEYPSPRYGTYVFIGDGGNGFTDYDTSYVGGRHIEYFVPGSGACYHVETTGDVVGISGRMHTAPEWYHGGYPVDLSDWRKTIPTTVDIGGDISIPVDMARALSAMNPTRPAVSIPNFIHELKDVPGTLQKEGLAFLKENARFAGGVKRLSSKYLEAKFGWAPMASDLLKMLDFQKDVIKTFKALQQIYKKGGLSRKYSFGKGSETHTYHDVDYIYGWGEETVRFDLEVYASARWQTSSLSDSLTNDQLMTRANLLTKGLFITPREVWDALPWSWFIDWFTNVGDFISSNQNVMDIFPTEMYIHTKAHASRDFYVTRWKESWWDGQTISVNLTGGSGHLRKRHYRRNVAPPATLAASSSYLNSSQVSTAVALIGQRGFKI